ncbi:MAG: CYTH domain-containing protein [Sphaerochaetaceae bacterium]
MNIEVECKIALSENEQNSLRELLNGYSKEIPFTKKDYYYITNNNKNEALRLRIEADDLIITKKDKNKEEEGFEINEEQQVLFNAGLYGKIKRLLVLAGYKNAFCKIKKGYEYLVKDVLVELVEIKDLGWFLELESTFNEPNKGIQSIKDVLKELSFENRELENRYYWQLLKDKGNGVQSQSHFS